ncbi:hypothetical protein C922_02856 [Plasmodium inui San Antonio 1]|uniref:Sel1 repeat-containing protein n=1 Tax=Plasmodium inui San Antonio 1 TaxID=1237626 RepID=W7ANH1_9APIC|nr:hypothetical protein C922_02856 [Plasmodium inui San Antonio 1]EUD66871.1 hypothetical protein C922_02856 [Plasmodium inui San Antonio 1]
MINNVFYVILVFSFFVFIIKCEYITNEKKEVLFETDPPQGDLHYQRKNSNLEGNYSNDVKSGSGTAGGNAGMQLQIDVLRGEEQAEDRVEERDEAGIALSVQGSIKSSVAKESELKVDGHMGVEEFSDSNIASGSIVVQNGESAPGNITVMEESTGNNTFKRIEPKGDSDVGLEEAASSDVINETKSESDNVPVVVEPMVVESMAIEPMAIEPMAVEPMVVESMAIEPMAVEPMVVESMPVEPMAVESMPVEPMAVALISNDTAKGGELKAISLVVVEEETTNSDVVTARDTTKESEHIADSIAFVENVLVSNNAKRNEPKTDMVDLLEKPTDSNDVKESEHISDGTALMGEVAFTNELKVKQLKEYGVVSVEESKADDLVKEIEHIAYSIVVVEEATTNNNAKESEPKKDNVAIVEESSVSIPVKEDESNQDGFVTVEEAITSDAAKESELTADNIAILEESSVSSPVKEDEPNQDGVVTLKEVDPARTIPDGDFTHERSAESARRHFLVEFQERVNQYDEAIDEIILRSLNRENYNYFNMLDEYAMKTKMSGRMYTGMRYIIKVIIETTVVNPSYHEKKKSFNYEIKESTFKRHFVTSLFRWYKNFKVVESHFDKANYVYYLGDDNERVYSYRYTYRLVLNLLSSETFSFYLDLNKFTLLDVLDNYNKYNFKLNNSTRYYPFHMYSCKSFRDFVVDYFESYNHRFFEKHKHLIAEEVYNNGIKKNGSKLFTLLNRLNPNFVLYSFRKEPASSTSSASSVSSTSSDSSDSPPPLVEDYLDDEIDLIFSIFKDFLVNLLNDLYNAYYNDEMKRANREASHVELSSGTSDPSVERKPEGEKTQWKEMTPLSDASSVEWSSSPGVGAGATSETFGAEDTLGKVQEREFISGKRDDTIGKRDDPIGKNDDPIGKNDDPIGKNDDPIGKNDDPIGKHDPIGKRDHSIGQRDDPMGSEMWRDLLESYKDAPKAEDLKKYNQYILKNLNKILNLSAQKGRQQMEDYKDKYELKDGFIVNVVTSRHTPLLFNPSKDIYLYLNQISSKKEVNFKNIYDNLMTIIKYKEGSNFYDNLLQSRRIAGGLWREVDPSPPGGEVNTRVNRSAKRVFERVVVDGDLSIGMNSNELNAFLLFIERGEEISGEGVSNGTAPTRGDVHSFYRNVNLSEFTPAAVTTKDQIHDQLKLLKKKYTEKLKNEATCVLAFLYLMGINDNGGKLQLPYGFPRNIDYSVKLIRKGKDGLCNFLSGILYHLNLPIFVNNSSISITTEMSEELLDSNDNSLNSFFYIYYRNNRKIRNPDFLSNENRIIPNAVDNIKSKIVSYSLGSTKDDFYSKLAFTNNMIRLKYKNKDSNIYLRDYFDFTFDKKIYKNSVIKNNISPFLSSCDYLLSNILGAVVDSLKNSSAIESGVYEENISEKHRHLIHNTVEHNKSLFEYFLKLADSRNSYALAALGEIYYLGNESLGIERDEMKAFEFWKKAADQGDSTSALSTGYSYLDEYKKHLRKEEIIKTMSKEDVLNMIKEEKRSSGAAGEGAKKDGARKEPRKESGGSYFAFASGGTAARMHTSVGQPSGQQNGRGSAPEGDSPVGNSPLGAPNFMEASDVASSFPSALYGGGSSAPSAASAASASSTPIASRGYAASQAGIPFGGGEPSQDSAENTTNAWSSQSDDIIEKYMKELSEERNKALKNAEQYFQKAIRNNEESIEHILAKYNIYKFGLGTKKNLELAGQYLKKAADKGDNISQMMLGHYYSGTDIGVKIKDYDEKNKIENLKKSYKYYSMSAKNGNIISLYNKSILILKGVNPSLKTFNEKCEKTLKTFHFIGLFNERLYVLTKLLRRNYDFRDYTGSLLVSVILSELGDHPNNVNASMLWDLKRKTMHTFTEKYNLVEGLLADYLQKALREERATGAASGGKRVANPLDRIIHRLYKKEKGGKYSLKMKSKLIGDSILKTCTMITSKRFERKSALFNMKFCLYLRDELLHRRGGTNKGERGSRAKKDERGSPANNGGRSNRAKKDERSSQANKDQRDSPTRNPPRNAYNYDVYQLTQAHKQIDLFERYHQIVKSEMEKGVTSREKIQKAEKIKGTIMEHFRTSEFLHCYYKPISYYQIKLEEEKRQSLKRSAQEGRSGQEERNNLLGRSSSYSGYTPWKYNKHQMTDLYEAEFSRYSPLLEGEDMKEIFYYQNTYSSSMFEEIQSFSKNCDICKQYYDIYSAYYGYKKSTIDLIKKYREGDEYTIKSKRKELQFLIRNSDEEDHEPLYYKALFLESNKLESLKNILHIYLKLATDNHNACNVIGVLGMFKILFKKVFFDVSFFFGRKKAQLISAIRGEGAIISGLGGIGGINWRSGGSTSASSDGSNERGERGGSAPAPPANSLQKYIFTDMNSCSLQNNFLFKSEFHNKCLNYDHFLSSNHAYSQISYRDFFKLFYTVVSSFFKVA